MCEQLKFKTPFFLKKQPPPHILCFVTDNTPRNMETRRKGVKIEERDRVAALGRTARMDANKEVRKKQQQGARAAARVSILDQSGQEEMVKEVLQQEMMRVQSELPPEKAALVNDILAEDHHGHNFVNFLLASMPVAEPVAADDALIRLAKIDWAREPSREDLAQGMNRIFRELPKMAAAHGWGEEGLEAMKNLVRTGLFGDSGQSENMSKELQAYMQAHGIVDMKEDRDLGKVCTFVDMEYDDLPDITGLVKTFGTITIPDEDSRKVHCFDVLKLEQYVLAELQKVTGIVETTLQRGLGAYYTAAFRTSSESIPLLSIRNPATGKVFPALEIVRIGEWADKVRTLKSLLDGTGAFTLTPADLQALISMRGVLVPDSQKKKTASSIWARVTSMYDSGMQHLTTLLDNMGIIWIIRQVLCIIARMLATGIYITKIGAETGIGLLATYIKQNMTTEVKDAITKALGGAGSASPPVEGEWSFVAMIKAAAASVASTIGGFLGVQSHLPDDVYLKIARNLFVGSLAAASGGWMGILKHVLASYGTFLVGKTMATITSSLYTIWKDTSIYDKAFAALERIGLQTGGAGIFVKAVQSIFAFLVPVIGKLSSVIRQPIFVGSVSAALMFLVPTLGPALVAAFGPVFLCQALYLGLTSYFSYEIFNTVVTKTTDLFANPLMAKVSSLETFLLISSPTFLCRLFTKGGFARKACDAVAVFLSKIIQTGKMFSLFVQSMSDVWYIQHVLRTGTEPTTVFGYPWKPSRCLTEWTHGPDASQVLKGMYGVDVLGSLATKPGLRGGMVEQYIPEFIRSFAADQITRPERSGLVMRAALSKGGAQKRKTKRRSKSLSRRRLSKSSARRKSLRSGR